MADLSTDLSTYDAESITVRGESLSEEIMGVRGFGESMLLLVTGEKPTEGEGRLADAMLSSLMVHGVTPHAIATRMTLLAEPNSVQGAVAAGLLGVGDRFVGAMQECTELIYELDAEDASVEALVESYRERGEPFPGIGHPFHEPVDPRAVRLFDIAEEEGVASEGIERIRAIQDEFEAATGKHLVINLTGAIAAVAYDMGLSSETARGLAIVSRAAGLVAEVVEERENPNAMEMWQLIEEEMAYPTYE